MKEQEARGEIQKADGSEVEDMLTHARMGRALVAADPVARFWTQQRKTYMLGGMVYNMRRDFSSREMEQAFDKKEIFLEAENLSYTPSIPPSILVSMLQP
jgi:hypothetical protein